MNDFLEESKRIKRVSSQMITMHSILRDQNKKCLLVIDSATLILSAFLIIFTFSEESILNTLNITPFSNRVFFGAISIALFLTSILQLKVDFGGVAAAHEKSIQYWFLVLKKSREACSLKSNIQEHHYNELNQLMDKANDFATPIPDKKFNRLKRKHLLKVEVSKQLDRTPGSWVWLIKAKIILGSFRELFQN